MANLSPQDFDTLPRLRDAIAAGAATVFKVLVTAVKVNGTIDNSDQVRARAGTVTYDVLPVDTDELFDPAAIAGVTPYNRKTSNTTIYAARVGDLMHFVRFGATTPHEFQYHLYALTEYPAYVGCDGQYLE